MKGKKQVVIAALTAVSLSFAANSFAMMGGGGTHGGYQERIYSGSQHRYDNYLPDRHHVRIQRYGYINHYSGELRYRDNVYGHYQGHHGNYRDVSNGVAPRNYHRRSVDVYVSRGAANGHYHHE